MNMAKMVTNITSRGMIISHAVALLAFSDWTMDLSASNSAVVGPFSST